MRLHYVRHLPAVGLGNIRPWALRCGWEITETRPYAGESFPGLDGIDLLIVLGGPMGACDEHEHAWLLTELDFVERAIEAGTNVLGICLGGQIVARALGARVVRHRHPELGWHVIEPTVEGSMDGRLAPFFAPELAVMQWHFDTFDLPRGAVHLARNEACENQAFSWGANVLGLQFHPEMTLQVVADVLKRYNPLPDGEFVTRADEMLYAARFATLAAANGSFLDGMTGRVRGEGDVASAPAHASGAAPSADVHLVDGTYELFRHFYALPRSQDGAGLEVGAVRGVLASMLGLLRDGATHIGVATDHVIESFRNEMWDGYKRGDGIDPELLGQFEPLEQALEAMGIVVWPMRKYEADDALASAAACLTSDSSVRRVLICTPDKDLAQCVVDDRVVQLDRRARTVRGVAGVLEKFGVLPGSIPDYLALVGDSADGYPGVRRWGAKSSSTLLHQYVYLEAIPRQAEAWKVQVRGAHKLAATLAESWDDVLLFRDLATLRTDAIVVSAEALRWEGPTDRFAALADDLRSPQLAEQAAKLAAIR